MTVTVIVLAAGQGKRMHSDLPKVLHTVANRPMIEHVLNTASAISDEAPIVVHGHGGATLVERLGQRKIVWVEQTEQLGTGHAVAQAISQVPAGNMVVILYGDVPLLEAAALLDLLAAAVASGFAILTARLDDPAGYGRIVRDDAGSITHISEHKDATPSELEIDEINTGVMAISGALLKRWIPALSNDNAQAEYYLTDLVAMACDAGVVVGSSVLKRADDAMGVNNRAQLAQVERLYQARVAAGLLDQGVTLLDPARLDVRGELECGRDVVIDVNVIFEGKVILGDGVRIGPNNVISNAQFGAGAEVLANCVIDSAVVGEGSRIGPFARLRPESRLGSDVHIGNFVEIKKSEIGSGSKVNHLSYVGDAEIGRKVNVGAGTITCNYDGAFKHKTIIEDDVFVGSDTQFVAPVRVGRGVTIAAGTTVTEDVEPERLVLSRVRQKIISGWQRPRKVKK